MLIILFGLSGAGKNFVGEILARDFGYYHWDADIEIPESMKERILTKGIVSQKMRDEFTDLITRKIAELKKVYSKIVISQALYKEKNRSQIASIYPDAKLILIKSTRDIILTRLQKRRNWVDDVYADKISHQFEESRIADAVIVNDLDEAKIIFQLQNLLKLNSLNNKIL